MYIEWWAETTVATISGIKSKRDPRCSYYMIRANGHIISWQEGHSSGGLRQIAVASARHRLCSSRDSPLGSFSFGVLPVHIYA